MITDSQYRAKPSRFGALSHCSLQKPGHGRSLQALSPCCHFAGTPSRLSLLPWPGMLQISDQDWNFLVVFCARFVPARPNSTDRPCSHTACQDLITFVPRIGPPPTFHFLSTTSGFHQHTHKFSHYHLPKFSCLLIGCVFWVD